MWEPPAVIAVASDRSVTWSGDEDLLVVPLLSWPSLLLPQQLAVPSSWRAQVWEPPAETAVASVMSATWSGVGEPVKLSLIHI